MTRRIDKLQINALNASNNQILVARGGELAFDDASNVIVGGATDAGFANVALVANFANTAGIANVSLLADTANVALEANIANLVLTLSNFTTDDLNEGSGNLYYTDARVFATVDPKLTTAIVTNSAASNKVFKVNALIVSNIDGTNNADVSVDLYRSDYPYYIVRTVTVPADASVDVLAKSVYLEEGDSLRVAASANDDLQVVCSYEEIS